MAKSSRALEIIPQDQIPLSRNQKEFNRLTAKIEKLRREIASRTDLYETLFAAAVEHILPADEAEARARLALAATLDKLASANRYDRVVKQDLAACIQDLCGQAFQTIEPSDEEKALYGRWSDSSYDEELEAQMAEEKDMFEFMMRDMFGMDVNMDELRDDPERFQQFQEELKEKVNSGPASSGRRKE
ncbi:MAG TPA: hypothetical protein VHS96_13200, partial [Bacteroidia bacterium]|nr:hypothetical protein [Bacteroidia bacterium]